MKKFFIFGLLLILFFCYFKLKPTNISRFQGSALGTTYSVLIADSLSQKTQEAISANIEKILANINNKMSTYLPESEISRFNDFHDTSAFTISHKTLIVITKAKQVADMSQGAFDITVAPLVALWGFGSDKKTTMPSKEEIDKIAKNIGYNKLLSNVQKNTIEKTNPLLQIDLSAIAKGFAVDEIGVFLKDENINNYMVEVGGEVRVSGFNNGNKWRIGIEVPKIETREIKKVLHLTDCSIATSGDYRNYRYFPESQKRFSHIIDPRTGYPITHNLASVSVISSNCMFSDAMATALMVLGEEKGIELVQKLKLSCYFIIHTEKGFISKETHNFSKFFNEK